MEADICDDAEDFFLPPRVSTVFCAHSTSSTNVVVCNETESKSSGGVGATLDGEEGVMTSCGVTAKQLAGWKLDLLKE